MNLQERHDLEAELTFLSRVIEDTPEERFFERAGFEHRKKEIERIIRESQSLEKEPTKAFVTFRGKPVIGTRGIFAKFAGEALSAFSDAIATVGASMNNDLGARGQVPERDKFSMVITAVARGSFGFQMEEFSQEGESQLALFETESPEKSPVESALIKMCAFLRATLSTDDELADAVLETDARAIESIRRFLGSLCSNEAFCAIDFEKEEGFRFKDLSEVQKSCERICQENIHEEDVVKTGVFEGILPKRRDFQFREDNSPDPIVGKIENEIEDVAAINDYLKQRVEIRLVKKVVGQGRPRYRLTGYTLIEPTE